ncbi:MAG: hypothetical protein JKX98_02730 [Alcanivoracaceae bacterium]|nr:hypothetical protein [Alcanivoracaceae bacterium]
MVKEKYYPLTSGQKGLWLLHQLDPLTDCYHIPLTFKFSNNVKLNDLEKVLAVFMQRHAIMRSSFHDLGGTPVRKENSVSSVKIIEHDVSSLNQQDLYLKVRSLSEVPFNLEQGPLLRAYVLNVYQGDKILLIAIRHLIFDGASLCRRVGMVK